MEDRTLGAVHGEVTVNKSSTCKHTTKRFGERGEGRGGRRGGRAREELEGEEGEEGEESEGMRGRERMR